MFYSAAACWDLPLRCRHLLLSKVPRLVFFHLQRIRLCVLCSTLRPCRRGPLSLRWKWSHSSICPGRNQWSWSRTCCPISAGRSISPAHCRATGLQCPYNVSIEHSPIFWRTPPPQDYSRIVIQIFRSCYRCAAWRRQKGRLGAQWPSNCHLRANHGKKCYLSPSKCQHASCTAPSTYSLQIHNASISRKGFGHSGTWDRLGWRQWRAAVWDLRWGWVSCSCTWGGWGRKVRLPVRPHQWPLYRTKVKMIPKCCFLQLTKLWIPACFPSGFSSSLKASRSSQISADC